MLPVNPDKSKSYKLVESDGFNITYLDGRNIVGDYFEDIVTIGDVQIKKQQLGLALESVRSTGIMGLGFSSNVATSKKYKTIIDNMVDQGLIDTAAFSLYLVSASPETLSLMAGLANAAPLFSSRTTSTPMLAASSLVASTARSSSATSPPCPSYRSRAP